MNKWKSKISWFALLTLSFATLSAQPAEQDKEHIPVASRPMTQVERAAILEERAARDEQNRSANGDEQLFISDAEDGDQTDSTLAARKVYYSTHAGAYHYPLYISPLGDIVELEDGSTWAIRPKDTDKTGDWMMGDTIVVTPNHAWFSSYDYCLRNQNTGASLQCNLSLGPIYNGIYTHWIISIDYASRQVYLEDGSIWSASFFDKSVINSWLPNDTVIIGVNDSWFSTKSNILINVNKLNYAAANCNH